MDCTRIGTAQTNDLLNIFFYTIGITDNSKTNNRFIVEFRKNIPPKIFKLFIVLKLLYQYMPTGLSFKYNTKFNIMRCMPLHCTFKNATDNELEIATSWAKTKIELASITRIIRALYYDLYRFGCYIYGTPSIAKWNGDIVDTKMNRAWFDYFGKVMIAMGRIDRDGKSWIENQIEQIVQNTVANLKFAQKKNCKNIKA